MRFGYGLQSQSVEFAKRGVAWLTDREGRQATRGHHKRGDAQHSTKTTTTTQKHNPRGPPKGTGTESPAKGQSEERNAGRKREPDRDSTKRVATNPEEKRRPEGRGKRSREEGKEMRHREESATV